jgi:catechol 2,3-dioxygenase-like lactoylglutathione lyase family enzyme
MRIQGIDHVQVAFPPEKETEVVAFYESVLGLKRIAKPDGTGDPRGAWFEAGGTQFHLGVQKQGFVAARKAHVGFVVDDLEALADCLQAANLPVTPGSDLPGLRRVFSEDPAGNRIEFLQRG